MRSILPYLSLRGKFSEKVFGIFFFLVLFSAPVCGQVLTDSDDEITITLTVPRLGNWEMTAFIKEQDVYLPVKDFFDVLQIKNSAPNEDTITGFIINPKANYLIDKANNRIIYEGKIFNLKPRDLISFENNLYLKSNYFGEVFGLECSFSFRSLAVTLNTKLELPAMRDLQLQQMRKNINLLRGDKKADTTLKRKFSLFNFGILDWQILNYKQLSGGNNLRVNTNLGAIVAGGETNIFISYTSGQPFDIKNQYYRWRYVNNDKAAIKQVTLGNLFVQSTASISGPLSGIQITNTPTTYRRSFGTYTISNTTEPNWMVELYVNNILINFTKADAVGFYSFEIPLVYGATVTKLRFYGPFGEERSSEQTISIPFNFLPVKDFEYSLSAGIVDDDKKSKFSRLNFNYGLSKRITLGGGMEYLSTLSKGNAMPFLNTSLRIASNLLFSAEHIYGVRSKGVLSYNKPSGIQVELNYIKYVPGQVAINSGGESAINNFLEDRKLSVFMPIRRKKFTAYSRLSFSQLVLPQLTYTTAELLLSAIYKSVNTNLTTAISYSDPLHPLIFTNLSMAFRVSKTLRVTPQAQFEYDKNNFTIVKIEMEKILWKKCFLLLNYDKYIVNKRDNISLGFRYNFSFAQTSFSVLKTNNSISSIQSLKGSILHNDKSHDITFSSQSNAGRGGLVILSFLDLNSNGKYDAGEPKVNDLKLRINGGRLVRNKKDSTIIISGLEAYTNYFVELDKNSFDNIGWQLGKSTMNIIIEPNNFRLIEVPVSVVGEVSGTVLRQSEIGLIGLARVIINFYDQDGRLVGKTLTEFDGYFNFVGLAPGNYTAEIDKAQMNKLNVTSTPSVIPFSIRLNKDGDSVEGIKFILNQINYE